MPDRGFGLMNWVKCAQSGLLAQLDTRSYAFRIMYIMLNAGRYYVGLLKLVSAFLIVVIFTLNPASHKLRLQQSDFLPGLIYVA